jgi:thiamine kinase-like enzyme
LPSFSLRQHIQSLKELADWLRFLLPADGLKILAIAQALSEKLNQLPVITTAIHGDFYADQILWQSNHIAIIDWDRATWGHPAQDIGNFIAHLERQALWDDQSLLQVRALEQALLTGYESRGGSISSEALRTYLAVGLFALVSEPFRYRHPHWPRQIQLILSRVNQLLQPVTAESLEPWVGAEC